MSKGSSPRPYSVPQKQFDSNWEAIFGKKEKPQEVNENDIVTTPAPLSQPDQESKE